MPGEPSEAAFRASRRRAMTGNEDARALRTRESLSASLERSLAKDPSLLPAVSTLCADAGVTRSAFYSHFSNVGDLIGQVLTRRLDEVAVIDLDRRSGHTISAGAATALGIAQIVEEVRVNSVLYRALFTLTSNDVHQRFVDQFTSITVRALRTSIGIPEGMDRTIAADFLVGGVLNVVRNQVTTETVWPAAPLVGQLLDLVPRWFVEDSIEG